MGVVPCRQHAVNKFERSSASRPDDLGRRWMEMPVSMHDGLRAKAADAQDEQSALDDVHRRAFRMRDRGRGERFAATRTSELPVDAIAGGDAASLRFIALIAVAGGALGRLGGGR